MGVVTALFVGGGNVEKLLCEPLASRQLFKVLNVKSCLNAPLHPPQDERSGSVLTNTHLCVCRS